MDNVFDQVIAGLEENHAFREVPGGGVEIQRVKASLKYPLTPGVYGIPLHKILEAGREVDAEDVKWMYRNQALAIRAYMPLELFAPWAQSYLDTFLEQPIDNSYIDLLMRQGRQIAYGYGKSIPEKAFPEPSDYPQAWFSCEQVRDKPSAMAGRKKDAQHFIILKAIAERQPALLSSHIVMQSAFPEWLYRLAYRIMETKQLTPEQYETAYYGIAKLTKTSTSRDYVFGPPLWVATKNYLRNMGAIDQPILYDDFQQGWSVALKDGFDVLYPPELGGFVTKCPFKPHVRAAAEVCQSANEAPLDLTKGAWKLFEAMSAPPALQRRHGLNVLAQRAVSAPQKEEPDKDRLYIVRVEYLMRRGQVPTHQHIHFA